ncbi:MAG: SAM-dependent methyltransferase, partial [Pseudomonadota bacterium]
GVLARHMEIPQPDPRAPGPFVFGDTDYVTDVLVSAGFAEPTFEPWEGNVEVGGPGAGPEEALEFVYDVMSIGDVIAEAPDEAQATIRSEIRTLFETNGVHRPAKAWIVRSA